MEFSENKIEEVKKIVENKYKTKYPDKLSRYEHILGVAKMCKYLAGIYKFKTDNVTSFVAVIKNGNTYNFCVDDKLEPCPPDYINLDCPSLVIFKKI